MGVPTNGISTPYPIQLLTFNAVYSWLCGPGQWLIDLGLHDYADLVNEMIDQVRIVMSRLKLKVNNCLLNNKEFFKLFNSIFNKIGYNCFIIFKDYLNIKILKYDGNFEILWNFCLSFEILYIFFNFQIFKFFETFEL